MSALRTKITSIVAGPNECMEASARRISIDIAKNISGGATINPVIGIWVDGSDTGSLNGDVEIVEKAYAIDVTVPSEQKVELLKAIEAAFLREKSRNGICARWIHTDIIEIESAHWQIGSGK